MRNEKKEKTLTEEDKRIIAAIQKIEEMKRMNELGDLPKQFTAFVNYQKSHETESSIKLLFVKQFEKKLADLCTRENELKLLDFYEWHKEFNKNEFNKKFGTFADEF